MNLQSADLIDPTRPEGPLLDADLTIRMLLDGPGDADPLQLLDAAIERLTEARTRLAALAADSQ